MNYISDLSQEKAMSAIKQGHTDLMALKDAIHGVVQERREAMTASDIDPIPDIPFT